MFEDDFAKRLLQLRQQKNVTARDMSLSIGQNAGYISRIESGKALPSMSAFLFICDFLKITPSEFFDTTTQQPIELRDLIQNLKRLDEQSLASITQLVNTITK